nr:hypothetical protein [Caulerpa lentillifera]
MEKSWIVGFVDGDGHFGFSKDYKRFYFVVSQDKRSVSVLYELKNFFKCGSVNKAGANMREYRVSSKKHLIEIILPFFSKNILQTSKRHSFEKFAKLLNYSVNSSVNSIESNQFNINIDLYWLIGFIDAEGSFVCSIINKTIRPQFIIGLNHIDKNILDKIKNYLTYGIRYTRKNSIEVFQISSNKNMYNFSKEIILTKGFKDRLKTYKRIRARKWCKIVFIMQQKQHKNVEGFKKIKKLYEKF